MFWNSSLIYRFSLYLAIFVLSSMGVTFTVAWVKGKEGEKVPGSETRI